MNTASFKQVSAKYAAVAEPALLSAYTAPCLLVSSSKNANTKGTNTNATTAIKITSAVESIPLTPTKIHKPIMEPMIVPQVARLLYSCSFFTNFTSTLDATILAIASAATIPTTYH